MEILIILELLALTALVVFYGVFNTKYYEKKYVPEIKQNLMSSGSLMTVIFVFFIIEKSGIHIDIDPLVLHGVFTVMMIFAVLTAIVILRKMEFKYNQQKRIAHMLYYVILVTTTALIAIITILAIKPYL